MHRLKRILSFARDFSKFSISLDMSLFGFGCAGAAAGGDRGPRGVGGRGVGLFRLGSAGINMLNIVTLKTIKFIRCFYKFDPTMHSPFKEMHSPFKEYMTISGPSTTNSARTGLYVLPRQKTHDNIDAIIANIIMTNMVTSSPEIFFSKYRGE